MAARRSLTASKDNYHMVAEWPERTGSRRMHTILITMHGKNICDPLSNMILAALRNAVANAREIGLLGASTAACGCAECAQFNFSSCLMKGLGGMATQLGQFKTPRVGACAAAAGRRERSRSTTLR